MEKYIGRGTDSYSMPSGEKRRFPMSGDRESSCRYPKKDVSATAITGEGSPYCRSR